MTIDPIAFSLGPITVMILQAIAAVAWIVMAVRVHNVMSIVLAAIFTLMALSSAVKLFSGGGQQ